MTTQQKDKVTALSPKINAFLTAFPNKIFTYIPDHNKDLPVIHSEILQLDKNEIGYGMFFSVNGFHGGKRVSENLTNVNAFFCDIDYPDKIGGDVQKINQYKNDLRMEMYESAKPPTAIVETKNGLHVYWLLEKPIFLTDLNIEQQERLRSVYMQIEEAILKKYDGDRGAKDIARVLRIPGTMHQKDPTNKFEVKLLQYAADNTYTFIELQEFFLKKVAPDGWAVAQGENPISTEVKEGILKEFPKLERDSYKKLFDINDETIIEGSRNKALLVAASAAKEAGWTYEQTANHFTDFHGLSVREIRRTIQSAFENDYEFGYNNEIMDKLVGPKERTLLSEVTSKVLAAKAKITRDITNGEQKLKYLTYEYLIAERNPYLKFKVNADFYNYNNGVYKPVRADEVRSLFLSQMLDDGLTNFRKVSSVNDKIACFKSIPGRTFVHTEENPNPDIINLKNGLLNIRDYSMVAHTPEYLSTSQIPIAYDGTAKCPQWRKFMMEIMDGDVEQIRLLQQFAGYCLTTDTRLAKAFILFGNGANGKSMWVRLISKIIGDENVSSIPLSIINKQFGLSGLVNKKMNIIDEISGNYFESNVIKGLISGERMSTDVKFRVDPLEFIPTAKFVFSINELPKINDSTQGLYRRFIIIPFVKSFAANPDLLLEQKLTSEISGILNWMIEGLRDLREEGHFTESIKNADMLLNYKMDNSPVYEYMSYHYERAPKGEELKYAVLLRDLYSEYRSYCYLNGYKPKNMSNFSRELQNSMTDWNINRVEHSNPLKFTGVRRLATAEGHTIVYPAVSINEF